MFHPPKKRDLMKERIDSALTYDDLRRLYQDAEIQDAITENALSVYDSNPALQTILQSSSGLMLPKVIQEKK